MDKTKPFGVSKQAVWQAYRKVKANKGAAGVDEQSLAQFDQRRDDNLFKLWNRLASGSYFPPPVKLVEIPKRDGGMRPLGIPTVADRIAQTVVAAELERVVETIFDPDSYGYRPGRSAHDALAACRQRCWRYDWVIDLDVAAFLDASSHCSFADCRFREQVVLGGWRLDTQAFSPSGADVDRLQLAALYTLQQRLAGHAVGEGRFEHGQPPLGCVVDEQGAQLVVHADAPGRAGGDLLAGDEPVAQPAVQGGGRQAELGCGVGHGEKCSFRLVGAGLVAWDVPAVAQALDSTGGV